MKHHFAIIAFALASCAAPLEETTLEECCMPVGQGQIFASGISILLKGPNEALQIADGNPPVKYLHFVGVNGQTIVPTYEPDGLDAGQGSKIGGAKLVLVSAADLAALEARVSALESDESIVALTARVEALERKQYTTTNEKTADYTANAWEHVLVNAHGLPPDVLTITMPGSPQIGDRVRVSEVSGLGIPNNVEVRIACTFASTNGGYYAASPYKMAPEPVDGFVLPGGTIELEYVHVDAGDGWIILQESYQVPRP